MRIESFSLRHYLLVLGGSLGIFLACVLLGALGPRLWEKRSYSVWGCPRGQLSFNASVCNGTDLADGGGSWTGRVTHASKLNQKLILALSIAQRDPGAELVVRTLDFEVDMHGRRGNASEWQVIAQGQQHSRDVHCWGVRCNAVNVVHEPFLDFEEYRFRLVFPAEQGEDRSWMGDVRVSFAMANARFTTYELGFRMVFFLLNVAMFLLFCYQLRRVRWRQWNVEQQWVSILLCGLMGHNNPFFALGVQVPGIGPVLLDEGLTISFLTLLLLYWLIMFDELRRPGAASQNRLRFFAPKVAFLAVLWVCTMVVFVWNEVHLVDDPSYPTVFFVPAFRVFFGFMILGAVVYLGWIIFMVVKAFLAVGGAVRRLGGRLVIFGVITMCVIALTVMGIVFGVLNGPGPGSAVALLAFEVGLSNCYLFVLAIFYMPSNAARSLDEDNLSMIDLGMSSEFTDFDGTHERVKSQLSDFSLSGLSSEDDEDQLGGEGEYQELEL